MTDRQQKVQEAREGELYRLLVENVKDYAIFVIDPEGRVDSWNPGAERLLGFREEEMIGQSIAVFFTPEDIEKGFPQREMEQALEQGWGNDDRWHVRKDGSRFWCSGTLTPLWDEGKKLRGFAKIMRDMTDRKRAEEALRQSEQRLRRMVNTEGIGVLIFDGTGTVVDANDTFLGLVGYSREDVAAKALTWRSMTPPEYVAVSEGQMAGLARTGRFGPYEGEYFRKDGSRSWMVFAGTGLGDGAAAECCTDIGDRKRAEEALTQSKARLSAELEAMTRLHAVSTRLFDCRDIGAALDEILDASIAIQKAGMGDAQLYDPQSQALGIAARRGCGQEFPNQFRSVGPGGGTACARTVRSGERVVIKDVQKEPGYEPYREAAAAAGYRAVNSTPLVSRQGELLGVLSTHFGPPHRPSERDLRMPDLYARQAADIMDRLTGEKLLRDADRHKDEFLATLAHELRNPPAPIRRALQILKMPRVDAATVQRSREMMERQLHRLVRLVDDLLGVSRVMRGKIGLRRERVELASVVARAVETVRPPVGARGHELSVRLPNESLPLDADPVRVAQVVGNLLTNAAKYTEPGGRIRLTATREGTEAVLRIEDNGIGIAPDVLPRIFDLFVQVDHATTKAQGGLGIGLTLVKNLVEMHDGSVEARSAGLGKGSEFVVRLPLTAKTVEKEAGPDTPLTADSPRPTGHRLLVVDDNRDAADSLAMLLQLQGHEVRVAHSGPAALEMTKGYAPDVVFLDIGMPGMDGYEVARRLRQQPGLEKVVLAALTGWGQQEDRRRTADAGFDHHLVKPPDPKAMEGVLAQSKKH